MMNMKKKPALSLFLLGVALVVLCRGTALAQWAAMNPVTAVQQQADGVVFTQAVGNFEGAGVLGFGDSRALLADVVVSEAAGLCCHQTELARRKMDDAIQRRRRHAHHCPAENCRHAQRWRHHLRGGEWQSAGAGSYRAS